MTMRRLNVPDYSNMAKTNTAALLRIATVVSYDSAVVLNFYRLLIQLESLPSPADAI